MLKCRKCGEEKQQLNRNRVCARCADLVAMPTKLSAPAPAPSTKITWEELRAMDFDQLFQLGRKLGYTARELPASWNFLFSLLEGDLGLRPAAPVLTAEERQEALEAHYARLQELDNPDDN